MHGFALATVHIMILQEELEKGPLQKIWKYPSTNL